jgi:hypothetical protein
MSVATGPWFPDTFSSGRGERMLLSINTKSRYTEKKRTHRLQFFGLDEQGLPQEKRS